MKKFSLHLEQEHVSQLEQSPTLNIDDHEESDDKPEIKTQTPLGSLYIPEIKVETCMAEDIKLEDEQENHVVTRNIKKKESSPKFQDPLEPTENVNDFSLSNTDDNVQEEFMNLKENNIENESEAYDVDMQTFSDGDNYNIDDQSELSADDNSSYSDFKADESADERSTKRNKQKSKEQDKAIILTLIEAYQNRPQLWNTAQSEKCNLKQKEDLLQSITDDINAKLNLKLKIYMVKKKLNSICKQYEKEVEQQMNEKEKVDSELWYYENMNFLKSAVECKLKHKKRKPNHKVKPLTDEIVCDLLDIYKKYNSLWDVNHLAFTVKDKRHETLQSMLEEIEKKCNLILDIYKLEKHLNHIHKSFSKDKQLRFECENKQLEFQPSCSYYDKCNFLDPHQGPFRCPSCRELIETYNDFQLHKSQHDGSIPFKCQECGMGFKKITNYTIHAKRHLRVFKFHCEICGKGYPFNAELDLHMRSHTGAQPYLCSVCGEGFRTAISYDNHIRRHEERFKYFCHICKKGFNHMTRLNDHVKAHLNVRDVICTVCGKGFTSRKYLNHHKRIHEGKNYSCNICGKSFAQDAGLRAHKKYHGTPIGISSIQKEQNKYKIL